VVAVIQLLERRDIAGVDLLHELPVKPRTRYDGRWLAGSATSGNYR
jgi:hypothetical protein